MGREALLGGTRVATEFIKANGDSLPEIHRAVLFARGNAHQPLAVAHVLVRQTELSEPKSKAAGFSALNCSRNSSPAGSRLERHM